MVFDGSSKNKHANFIAVFFIKKCFVKGNFWLTCSCSANLCSNFQWFYNGGDNDRNDSNDGNCNCYGGGDDNDGDNEDDGDDDIEKDGDV